MDWDDGAAEVMAIGKHAAIAGHVNTRRRNEGNELGDELLGTHVHGAVTSCNVESNTPVGQPMHGVRSKGRAKEIATQMLEPFAVAPVDGGGGMQVHAEGVDVQCGGYDGGRCAGGGGRLSQLDARGDARVDVDVVVGELAQDIDEVGIRWHGQPSKLRGLVVVGFLERAIGHQAMQVHIQASELLWERSSAAIDREFTI